MPFRRYTVAYFIMSLLFDIYSGFYHSENALVCVLGLGGVSAVFQGEIPMSRNHASCSLCNKKKKWVEETNRWAREPHEVLTIQKCSYQEQKEI